MHEPIAFSPSAVRRRLILGTAFLLGLALSLPDKTTPASAQETKAPVTAESPAAPAESPAEEARRNIERIVGAELEREAKRGEAAKDAAADKADAGSGGTRSITINKGGKTITLTGMPHDREFDSIGQFAQMEPTLATMIVAIVALVFLAPVLAIALILGYRMRKARMLNDTMLKLAEKGIVPPAEVLDAVVANNPGAANAGLPPAVAPLYEKAKAVRRRAAWSDLRKGIVLGAIGLGLTLFSVLEDRTPNSVGLVLLFVGIGYGVLWWFEQRHLAPSGDNTGGDAGPGAG